MGLLLDAACRACGYARAGLRLGATHAQIDRHDIEHHELFAAPCCREVISVVVLLGQPWSAPPCERCGAPLAAAPRRYRVSTLKGEVLDGHPCPRCGEPRLAFERRGAFR